MMYDRLYSDFKALFPEDSDVLNKLSREANADESDGMHVMFSFVIIPFVLSLMNANNTDKLKTTFDYFEKMALSDSADITGVLEFTVIENLMSNGQRIYESAKKYMKPETIKCCKRVEKYLNIAKSEIATGKFH